MKRVTNPILAREVKERMRSLRAPIVLTLYLLLLGLVVFGTERAATHEAQFGNPLGTALIGRNVFHWFLSLLLLVVCFLVPALAAGTISTERERQTFHLLQVTMMRPSSIVLGKLGSTMAYLVFMILATIPLVSVSFVLGGVSPLDVVRGYAMVVFTGFTLAMLGIAVSSNMRRTLGATVISFTIALVLTIGTFIAWGLIQYTLDRNRFDGDRHRVSTLVLNPFVGTASAIQGRDPGRGGSNPFDALFGFLVRRPEFEGDVVRRGRGPGPGLARFVVPEGGVAVEARAVPARALARRLPGPEKKLPVWVSTVAWYSGLSGLAYLLALRGVRAPRRMLRLGRARGEG